jgi:hypothetical protein
MKLLLFLIPQSHEDFDLLFGLEDSIGLILNDLVIYLMLFFLFLLEREKRRGKNNMDKRRRTQEKVCGVVSFLRSL